MCEDCLYYCQELCERSGEGPCKDVCRSPVFMDLMHHVCEAYHLVLLLDGCLDDGGE
jgi:hypothetical protein